MTDRALPSLQVLRTEAVEAARRALALAQRRQDEVEQAALTARRALAACESRLHQARLSFAVADTVDALRATEVRMRVLRAEQGALSLRVRSVERARQEARCELSTRQAELAAAEVARRVVVRTLEQRAADVLRRTEQRAEDELDDAYRSRHASPQPHGFPRH